MNLANTLSLSGGVVMTLSIGCVIVLLSFCLVRVLTLPPVDDE